MRMTIKALISGFASLGLSFTASAQTPPTTIGTLAELTGPYARLGDDCKKAYEVAKLNLAPTIKVVFGDNQSDPKVAISEFRKMIGTDHASIVVTTRSPVGLALNPLSAQYKIPLIGVIGHPRFTKENPFAIRVFPSASDEAAGLALAVSGNKERTLATISLEDEYFLGLKNAFEANVGADNVVFSKTVSPSEHDFAGMLALIKEKKPSGIFLNVGPAQFGPIIKRIHEMNMDIRIYSNFLVGAPDVRKGLGALANGIIFAETDYDKPGFKKALEGLSGSAESSPIGYGCYVGLSYALQLADYAARKQAPATDVIADITEIATLDGPVVVKNREAQFSVVTKVIRNGVVEKAVTM